jgi:hypothetical protein
VQDTIAVPATPTVRLRRNADETLRDLFGSPTNADLAPHLGLDQSQLSRLQRQRCDVYPQFLARLVLALEAKGQDSTDLLDVLDTDGSFLRLTVQWERVRPHCQTCSQDRRTA